MQKHFCLSPADRAAAGTRRDVVEGYMALRLRYVTDQGWLHDVRSDHDVYDNLDTTRYFIRLNGTADRHGAHSISAGLRLTRTASFRDSLTWSMLRRTAGAQKTIRSEHRSLLADLARCGLEEDRGLWDVTRLVASLDGSASKPEIVQAVYELIGMAIYETVIDAHADPAWIFLTTASVKRMFDASGIQSKVIFSGRVTPTDDYDSFLCVARPKSAFRLIERSDNLTHRRALKSVITGCDAWQRHMLPSADALPMTGT